MTTTYVGTNGSDLFNVDSAGSYIVTTGAGADDIVLGAASGSLGAIVVTDFQAGLNGDQLDLLPFLQSISTSAQPSASDPFAGPNLRLAQSGADTLVEVNLTGGAVWTALVILKGVDANALTWANFPDIQPTAQSVTGYPIAVPTVAGGPTPTPGVLTGTSGDDTLVGSASSEVFHGGGGSDRIFGGGGIDTATYDGALLNYTVTAAIASEVAGPGYIYQVSGGPEGGTDTLVDIQRIQFVDGYLTFSPTDTAGQVYRLYEATLNRAPDQEGLTNWTQQLNSGASLQSVVDGFVNSPEFQADYGANLSNNDFVTLLYHNVLHRDPDQAGLTNWVSMLTSGQETRAQVVTGFSESPEDINDLAAPVQQGLWIGNADAAEVARLYDTVLGRLPDPSGLASWTQQLENGASLQSVANGFVGSAEFQAVYGNLNNSDFVTLLYHNVLHRDPDQAGLASWVGNLASGETRAQVVVGFSESAEHIANTAAHVDNGIWLAS